MGLQRGPTLWGQWGSRRLMWLRYREDRGSGTVLKRHQIQARQQQVLTEGRIFCAADLTCLELHTWVSCKGAGISSCPSPHQYFGQRAAKSPHFSLENFRAGMLLNFAEKRVHCCTSCSLPAYRGQWYPRTVPAEAGKKKSQRGRRFPSKDEFITGLQVPTLKANSFNLTQHL